VVYIPGRRRHLPTWPLLAETCPAIAQRATADRRGTTPGPAWSARSIAPRRAASAGIAPALRAVTIPAGPRTTFRCVAGEPSRFTSSRLRRSPDPQCRRPPPALPTRDRDRWCKRSSHALRRPRVAHGSCGATSAPTPHAVSLSRPRFIEPRRPSPASPAGSAPEPLSGKQQSSFPANEPGTRSCLKPPLTRHATRLSGLSRHSPSGDGGTPGNRAPHWFSGSFFSRAQEKRESVSVPGTDFCFVFHARPPPEKPRRNPKCAVLEDSESALRIPPPRGGHMPPRRPCRPDRDAFGLASRASCPPCRHVAAFPGRGSRPRP